MAKDCSSPATISASAGGSISPSETASVNTTTSSAPLRCAISAAAFRSSTMPKKLGDCTITAAVSSFTCRSRSARSIAPVSVS